MRILIVKLSSIGDVIHTLPALAALRRKIPEAEITWVVERTSAQLLRGNPALDRLVELDTLSWRSAWIRPDTWQDVLRMVRELKSNPYDIGFDFQGLIKSGLVLSLSRARRRIGFETAALREKPSLVFLTQQIPVSDEIHVIQKNLQLLAPLGIGDGGPYEFPMHISEEDVGFVARKLKALGVAQFAIINPGGNWKGKMWSPEGYAKICEDLQECYGLASVITYGPAESECAREIADRSRYRVYPFPCTLKQLAALADRTSLFIGGDTGPMHLAAARGAPIVALFGGTLAYRNGPFSADDEVVQDPGSTPSAYYRQTGEKHYMNVDAQLVQAAIGRRLARARSGKAEIPARRTHEAA